MLKKMTFGFVICAAAASTHGQPEIQAKPNSSAYMQDARGTILRSEQGLCWRTSYWTPEDAVPGCDGELVPPVAKPTAPAIVSPPPAPTGPEVPAVATAPRRCDFTVTLSSDEAFAFNRTDLGGAATKRLDDEVIPGLAKCAKIESVVVTGHTDRLGTDQYNQKLSEQRASAVAEYLKAKGATINIATLGAGRSQPVRACSDALPRSRLIQCLAANRRVAIEIRGVAD